MFSFNRLKIVLGVFFTFLVFILFEIFSIQTSNLTEVTESLENQNLEVYYIPSPRGEIYDINNKIIAKSVLPRGSKKKRKLAQAAAAIPDQVAATTPELVAAAARGAVADAGGGASSDSVVRSYGGILTFAFVGPAEALVVEQPWLRVMDHFPPALYRHRFGT